MCIINRNHICDLKKNNKNYWDIENPTDIDKYREMCRIILYNHLIVNLDFYKYYRDIWLIDNSEEGTDFKDMLSEKKCGKPENFYDKKYLKYKKKYLLLKYN